jgi:hypothetical protein
MASGSNIRWYKDAALSQEAAKGNSFQPVIETTTSYYVTQTVDGCESKAAQISITIKPRPSSPRIQFVDKFYCEGEPIAPITAMGDHIRWYTDQERTQLIANGQRFQPTITSTSAFYATQTVNGCEGEAQMVEVQVQPASITLSSSGDTLIAPVAESYQWYFEGMLLPKAGSHKLVAKNTGHYQVILHNKGCTSISQLFYHTVTITSSSIKLSPNPASSVVNIELIAGETGEVDILVYNQLGQMVKQLSVYKKYNQLEYELTISNLPQGMYIIEASTSKKRMKAKFIKL